MRPTLKDIASETGLSLSTVSRILSRRDRRNTENEALVLACARKLNYPFIHVDKEQKRSRTGRIALVTQLYEGEFYSSLYYWFNRAACDAGIQLSIVEASPENLKSDSFTRNIRRLYDGICLFKTDCTAGDYRRFQSLLDNMPMVSLAPIIDPVLDTVTFDSYRGGYLVAQHFEELEMFDVGIISGPARNIEAMYRKNGFMDYVENSDRMKCKWRFEGDYSIEAGHRAYTDLKRRKINRLAIFGSNDQTCIGLMRKILEDGKLIPKDYAVAGYDNLPICRNFFPSLTSVSTDFKELAAAALSILREKQQSQSGLQGQISLIPVSLKVRNSTAVQR